MVVVVFYSSLTGVNVVTVKAIVHIEMGVERKRDEMLMK